jgi:hypothetical protein
MIIYLQYCAYFPRSPGGTADANVLAKKIAIRTGGGGRAAHGPVSRIDIGYFPMAIEARGR